MLGSLIIRKVNCYVLIVLINGMWIMLVIVVYWIIVLLLISVSLLLI